VRRQVFAEEVQHLRIELSVEVSTVEARRIINTLERHRLRFIVRARHARARRLRTVQWRTSAHNCGIERREHGPPVVGRELLQRPGQGDANAVAREKKVEMCGIGGTVEFRAVGQVLFQGHDIFRSDTHATAFRAPQLSPLTARDSHLFGRACSGSVALRASVIDPDMQLLV